MTEHIIPSAESLLAAAQEYHARGWSVIPMAVTFDSDGRAGEKKPARKWKPYQTRRATEATLRRWCADPRVNGLAVVFGPISGGLVARDYDEIGAYQAWAAAYPELAATLPTMATRRGRQVFAIAAPGSIEAIRADIGKAKGTGAIALGDGELRAGVGCYSVLPPSVHPSGIAYRWLIPPAAEIPILDIRDCGFFVGGGSVQSVSHPYHTTHTPHHTTISCIVSDLDLDAAVEAAILASLPREPNERHYSVFDFARELKAIDALADASAAELVDYVRRWHSRATALPNVKTKEWKPTWDDFRGAWGGVKFSAAHESLKDTLDRADASEPPKEALQFRVPGLRRLVALCRELQRAVGDAPFFLDCRAVAALLGVHHDTIAEWLKLLRAADILRRVSLGDFARHKAAEYRYLPPL